MNSSNNQDNTCSNYWNLLWRGKLINEITIPEYKTLEVFAHCSEEFIKNSEIALDMNKSIENIYSTEETSKTPDIEKIQTPPIKPNEKFFVCTFENCAKLFEYKWILERHINSHFCFKMHKCDYENCNKAYKSRENLNLHVKNKHLGIKPYQCNFCSSRFSHRNGKF
jgi:hypothetical protein